MVRTKLSFFSTFSAQMDLLTMPTLVANRIGADRLLLVGAAKSADTDAPPMTLDGPCVDGDLFSLVAADLAVGKVTSMVHPESTLLLIFADRKRRVPLVSALEKGIPAAIRGDFMPGEISLMIGPHYVCPRSGPLMQEVVPTRTCCSVSIAGYGSPSHWPEYQTSLLKVPEFLDIQADLSAIIPQLRFGMVFVP